MPELMQSVAYASPELMGARETYENFAGLPQLEIIEEGILVETTSTFYKGQEYAVRSYLSPEIAQIDFESRLPALVHGLGRKGLEQLVAYSPEDGVLVTKRQPGRPISAIGLDEVAAMTKMQFTDLALAIDFAARARIEVNSPSKILYSPVEGFTIVDYTPSLKQPSTGRTLQRICKAMTLMTHNLHGLSSEEAKRLLETVTHMVVQAGFSTLSQSDSRAVLEAKDKWTKRRLTGNVIVGAK